LTPKRLGSFKNLLGVLQDNGGCPSGVSDMALKKPTINKNEHIRNFRIVKIIRIISIKKSLSMGFKRTKVQKTTVMGEIAHTHTHNLDMKLYPLWQA